MTPSLIQNARPQTHIHESIEGWHLHLVTDRFKGPHGLRVHQALPVVLAVLYHVDEQSQRLQQHGMKQEKILVLQESGIGYMCKPSIHTKNRITLQCQGKPTKKPGLVMAVQPKFQWRLNMLVQYTSMVKINYTEKASYNCNQECTFRSN